MPTTVVAKSSNSSKAKISKADLTQITDAFKKSCKIESTDPKRTFIKTNSILVPLASLKTLIETADRISTIPTKNGKITPVINIKIKFGITLVGQTDCTDNETDIANQLTIVMLIEKDGVEMDKVNDSIVTPGFKGVINGNALIGENALMLANGTQDVVQLVCCPQVPPVQP